MATSNISYTPEGAVSVSYPTLCLAPGSLQPSIEEAFGSHPKALGIIIVKDLPREFVSYRERLLRLAYKFATLDEERREKYTDPLSRYSFGWSHGKEIMNGKPDLLKGSYYADPTTDAANVSEGLKTAYPEYYGKNIWPDKEEKGVEGFEKAFKDLGRKTDLTTIYSARPDEISRFIHKAGCQLAGACQPFVSAQLVDSSLSLSLPKSIATSQTTKARLLHYFPPPSGAILSAEDEPVDSWCGFHLDHSVLTGLCSAMFLRQEDNLEATIVSSPSPTSGLYIRTRGGDLTKITIPEDCLAFQTGEALQIATNGKLRATPHCVRAGGAGEGSDKISRETFALFMQPDTDQLISATETFGQFSKRIFDRHYEQVPSM